MKLGRRSVLASVPAMIGGWILARLDFGASQDIEKLLHVLGDRDAAAVIGVACLEEIEGISAHELVRGIPADAGLLRAVIRDDFVAGRIVIADGWVLSSTEARLYALAALSYRV